MKQILLGNEAIAAGAHAAGVKVISSYPGTPSTEITEAASQYEQIACEWAPNEKVGLEVAVGASLAGARAMSCMKHVGLNVAADPLFTSSYTGVNGGLVVVVADDPGMHSSQNEQDSRHYARAAKLPMFEPADSQECQDMTRAAFELSEQFDTPVLVRLTTRIAHTRSPVELSAVEPQVVRPYAKNIEKHVMMPAMARKRHRLVEDRMSRLAETSESVGCHQIIHKSRSIGFVTSGVVSQYVREAFPDASVFKLGLVWPLPIDALQRFAADVDRLIIAEELDPVIETELKAAGIACEGKTLFTLCGEYSTALIRSGLETNKPTPPAFDAGQLTEAPARPPVLCAGCPHRGLFMALKRLKVIVTGDIGCYTLGALNPTYAMDTCVCMGASIGMAHGIAKATNGQLTGKTVAVIGDSTFLHSGMTGLLNSVYNQSDSTILILDNSITGMTGHQQNPSTGLNIRMQQAPSVDLEALCRVLGAASVRVVDPADSKASEKTIAEELKQKGVSVIIARRPCALIPQGKGTRDQLVYLDQPLCTRCGACIRLMCPALTAGPDGYPVIDPDTCNGCGLCIRTCRFQALKQGGGDCD
ncbi:MAG: indolepyruvate ferredoxin oxidoreductase subunit alpha [Clostridiaceae bacterium]|nr:indolepyruvate ferredoxin oxidoreductase subunit alpha [Clostridiaceae bacterium]